jgi:hypothetical protein
MTLRNVWLALASVLLLAALLAPAVAAESAPPLPPMTVTSRTGAGFVHAGQLVWHGPDCPAPTGMTPEGGAGYACPPAVKLPQPPPSRRPLPIRWP